MGARARRDQGPGVDSSLSEQSDTTVTVPRTRRRLTLSVAGLVVVADQLTKWWAVRSLGDRDIDVVWTLRFRLTHNTGASFSLGGDYGPWIALVALGVVVFLVWHSRTVASRVGSVALGLVVGGAVGNLIDRVLRGDGLFDGAVVDFIDFQWWPVFNVADMGIVIGGALLAITALRRTGG